MTHQPPLAALAVEQVSHRYDQRLALDGLNLEVQAGEIFALLGPNGSGKTTLFRLISTIRATSERRHSRVRPSGERQLAEVRSSIGIVFQSPSLDRKLTVLETFNAKPHCMVCKAQRFAIG